MPTLYVFALVQLTRFRPARRRAGGVRFRGYAGKPGTTFFRQFHCRKHCFRRTRLYCSDCGENVGTERITNLICSRKLGGCESASIFHGTRSTQRQGDKRQRRSRRNRVTRTVARRFAQSTSEWPKTLPRGSNGGRSLLGTPFSPIFRRATKDGVPEGPTEKRMPVKRKNARLRPRRAYRKENAGKNVKSKIKPPKGVRYVES